MSWIEYQRSILADSGLDDQAEQRSEQHEAEHQELARARNRRKGGEVAAHDAIAAGP